MAFRHRASLRQLILGCGFCLLFLPVRSFAADPITHWRLDDGSGTSAADSSGNGYTGTLTGTQGWTTGQIAGGFSFNYAGGDDYFTFPANPTLNDVNEGDYTLSAWVKPLSIPPGSGASNNATYAILMKTGNHIGLAFSASGRFSANHYLTGGVFEGVSSTNTYAANVWYHVTQVVSKSLGHTLLYVDGVLQGTNTFTAGTASQDYGTGPWRLGIASPGAGEYRWHSHLTVDDVRVYSQALSAAEVTQLYAWTDAPVVQTLSPADNVTDVSVTSNLVLTFDETTRAGTGSLSIKRTSDNVTVETITVSGSQLSGNGTTQLTLNPSVTLSGSTSYYITWTQHTFKDDFHNFVAAQTSTTYWNFTTEDVAAPVVHTLSPADNATNISRTADLVLTFDEAVRVGTGTLAIKRTSDNVTVETITVSGSQLSGNGSTQITLNPAVTLSGSTNYYITWTLHSFKDDSHNFVAAQTSTTYWNFTTEDVAAPVVHTISPADNATNVSHTANLALTFDEAVRVGTGTLSINRTSDNATIETITVSGSQLSGNGSTQLTLNPNVTLSGSTSYYITWSQHAFKDDSHNFTAARTSPTYWNFTTGDFTAPTVSSLSPIEGATDVATTANLILTFDEAVQGGTGSVIIKKGSDNSVVESISATGALVSGSGTTILTVDPSVTLAHGTAYYVQVEPQAIRDASNNYYAGISDTTTWNFTTAAAASSSSSSSESGGGGGGGGGGRRGSPGAMARRISAARDRIVAQYQGRLLALVATQGSTSSQRSTAAASRHSARPPQQIVQQSEPPSLQTIGARRGVLVATVDDAEILYRDVPTDAWFAPYVAVVIEEGIAEGYRNDTGKPTGEFGVENPITLAEVLKMAFEAAGISMVGLPPPRNRTAKGTWAEAYAAAAEERGLLKPDQDIHAPATRGEVITVILRIMGLPISNKAPPFSDVPAGHPQAAALATAAFYDIIQGDTGSDGAPLGTLRPDDPINRAEVSKIVALVFEVVNP